MSQDCENYDEKKPLKVGPFGESEEGDSFDDGVHSTVKRLVITHGVFIQSIQIEYDDNGSPIWSDRHGELSHSNTTDKVTVCLVYTFYLFLFFSTKTSIVLIYKVKIIHNSLLFFINKTIYYKQNPKNGHTKQTNKTTQKKRVGIATSKNP